jgi:hypothetical protein
MDDALAPGLANIRCAGYWIASTMSRCGSCGELTRVVAVALPPGHETLDLDASEGAAETWVCATLPAVLFAVYHLTEPVRRELQRRSVAYRLTSVDGAEQWNNHCEHCGAPQDEEELHGEPDAGFMPASADTGARIRVEAIAEPFLAGAAGYAPDPVFWPHPAVF